MVIDHAVFYHSRQVLLDHPAAAARSFPRSCGIELAVTLDGQLRQFGPGNTLGFQHSSQTLGNRHSQSDCIFRDEFGIQPVHADLHGVEHLGEAPTVPGHGESIQQRALQIRYGYVNLTNPPLPAAEEAVGLDLSEPVQRISYQEAAPGALPLRPVLPQTGHPGVRCGKNEHVPRYLLCQPVIVQGRPVGDHGRRDEGRGDFDMGGYNPGHRGRKCVETSAKRHDPVVPTEVIQGFDKVGVLQANAGHQFPGPVRCEDAVPLVGKEPDQLDADKGLLGLYTDCHWRFQGLHLDEQAACFVN